MKSEIVWMDWNDVKAVFGEDTTQYSAIELVKSAKGQAYYRGDSRRKKPLGFYANQIPKGTDLEKLGLKVVEVD